MKHSIRKKSNLIPFDFNAMNLFPVVKLFDKKGMIECV